MLRASLSAATAVLTGGLRFVRGLVFPQLLIVAAFLAQSAALAVLEAPIRCMLALPVNALRDI